MTRVGARALHGESSGTLLAALAVVIWGCTPRVTAIAVTHAGPLTLTSLRAAPTAAVLLLAVPLLRGRLPHGKNLWFWTAVTGLLMVTVFLGGFTEAIIRAGPGNAIVLASTTPFFIVILGRIIYGERVSLQALGGLLAGFVGVVLVVSSQLGGHAGGRGDLAIGMALALAAAVGWAAGTLVVKELVQRYPDLDFVGFTTAQYLVGGSVLLAISFAAEGTDGANWSSGELWLVVAFISIVASALATLAYFGALRRMSATRVTTWAFLSPVVAVLLEIILGHTPRPVVFGGMALTIAGIAIVTAAPQLVSGERSVTPELLPEEAGAPSL
jgi:drug/metabolite transporter (DMT)-like permease